MVKRMCYMVDPYVPLKIELDSSSSETPLYWRAHTEDGSLVEVGLSPIDGSLCTVTLTTISPSRVGAFEAARRRPD